MMTKLKEASVLFFIQVLSYTIWCINFRAVADAQYHTSPPMGRICVGVSRRKLSGDLDFGNLLGWLI